MPSRSSAHDIGHTGRERTKSGQVEFQQKRHPDARAKHHARSYEAIGIPIQAAHSINRGKLERQNKFGGMTSSCIIVETAHGIKDEQRNDKRFFPDTKRRAAL